MQTNSLWKLGGTALASLCIIIIRLNLTFSWLVRVVPVP
jgi:hypothetical protein